MSPSRSSYLEQSPPPAVADTLVCLWTQEIASGAAVYSQSVLPDGCIDVVWRADGQSFVAGPATRNALVELPAGTILVGARFRPGLVPGFFGLPAQELLNRDVPLCELWRDGASGAAERIFRSRTVGDRLQAAAAELLAFRPGAPCDPVVRAAVHWLAQRPGGRVSELAGTLDVSSRQLRRRFAAGVGYGPKTFQRIMRLQRLLELAGTSRHQDLAGLAFAAGYADQAHMTREVGELTGSTPTASIPQAASTLSLAGLFDMP